MEPPGFLDSVKTVFRCHPVHPGKAVESLICNSIPQILILHVKAQGAPTGASVECSNQPPQTLG